MARLPQIGEEDWGGVLNAFLLSAHNNDGSLKPVQASKIIGLQEALGSKYVKPLDGIPMSDLHPSLQSALQNPAQVDEAQAVIASPGATRARLANTTTQNNALSTDPVTQAEKGASRGVAVLDAAARTITQQESRSVEVGMHFPGYENSTGLNTTTTSLKQIEADLKFTADYTLLFQAVSPNASFTQTQWDSIVQFFDIHTSVVLNLELMGTISQIQSGSFDEALDQLGAFVVAHAAANPNKRERLYVKLLHEANLTATYPWCVYAPENLAANGGSVTQTAAKYVEAYRRAAERLKNAATTNGIRHVQTIWEIGRDNNSGSAEQFDIFYPGDDVVDICSINNYNRFGIDSGYAYYNAFGTSFKPAYEQVKRIAPSKPVMVGETSSTPGGYIKRINVTNGGSGYGPATTAVIKGDGSGATATVQTSGGKITGLTITNQGQDYTNASITLENSGGGAGAILSPDIRGGRFSKSRWYKELFEYLRDETDVLYLTFFFENKFVSVTDNRQWAPNTTAEKSAWTRGYNSLNRRVQRTLDASQEQVIRKNLCPDPKTTSLDIWKATGTNVGTLNLSTNPDNFPDHSIDLTSVLQLTHNGTAGKPDSNRFYFTIPYTLLAPNQNITISFDARSRSSVNDTSKHIFVQPGVEMVDSPNTFERNYPPLRVTNQYKRYVLTVNNGQYSPGGWRICWRIGTSTLNGSLLMTNIKVEYGEVASPMSTDAQVFDATASKKGVLQLAGDLAGTSSAPTVPTKLDRVRFGLWHTSSSLPTTDSSISQAKDFERAIKAPVDMIIRYGKVYSSLFASDVKPILDAGYDAQFFLEPTNGETTANLDTIIQSLQAKSGPFYDNFYFFFKDLAQDGRSEHVILCMFHEGNGDGFYPWQAYHGSNSPEKYKQAYRLTIELARSLGAKSKFAQIYLTRNSANIYNSFEDMYVGDDYIDLVGVTDYNRQGISYGSWRYPGMLLKSAYAQLTRMSRKPVMIAESNCVPSHDSYSRSLWFEQYKNLILSDEYQRIWSYSLFSEDKSGAGDPNWFINSPEDLHAIGDMVTAFHHRPETRRELSSRQPNNNLLSASITSSLNGWSSFGQPANPTLAISGQIPDWFDPSERSLKVNKVATTASKPQDINIYFTPSDFGFWKTNQAYTLSFWAKSSHAGTYLGTGVREHQGTFQIYADYTIRIDQAWRYYTVTFATDIPFTNGIRVPWFALGQNNEALELHLAGMKLEYGHVATQRLTHRSFGLDKVDNTADLDKPVSRTTQQALDKKLSFDSTVTDPVNFKADRNVNILAIKNSTSDGHNVAALSFESKTDTSREIQTGLYDDFIKRFSVETSGKLEWGPGGNTYRDTVLYRNAERSLRTDGLLTTDSLRIMKDASTGSILVSDGRGYASWKKRADTTPIVKITDHHTISASNHTVLVDAASKPIGVQLPSASDTKNAIFVVKKIDSSSNAVTIMAVSGDTIDGSVSRSFNSQYATLRIQTDGENWWVV